MAKRRYSLLVMCLGWLVLADCSSPVSKPSTVAFVVGEEFHNDLSWLAV